MSRRVADHAGAGPARAAADGVTVTVRLTPTAAADRIDGIAAGADGAMELRARVTAAPENDKANDALIRMLAKHWKIPKSVLHIARGAKNRRKTVHIAGNSAERVRSIETWLGRRNG